MNIIKPIKSKYTGYYEIPGYSNYVVTPKGVVMDKLHNNIIVGSTNVHGYHLFQLISDSGKSRQISRHRMLCLVFKNEGINYDFMHVGHNNHTPGDDWLDNLDWVTPSENSKHAAIHGRNPVPVKVQTKCLVTGNIKTYESFIACGRDNDLNRDMVIYRVKSGPSRMFNDKKQYRYYSDSPWPIINNIDKELMRNDCTKPVACYNLQTDEEFIFDKVSDMAKFLNLAVSTMSVWLSYNKMHVMKGGWLVKHLTDDTLWRSDIDSIYDMFDDYNQHSKRKVVQVTNDITGLTNYYWSAADAARAHDLKVTALDYRLKSLGQTVFGDNCRYGYYPY